MGFLMRVRGRALAGGRKGPDFWELTASPLTNNPWTEHLVGGGVYDPTILCEAVVRNYGVVDIDLDRTGREVVLTLKDTDGAALFGQEISLSALRVRAAPPKLWALTWTDGAAHFFRGGHALRQDLSSLEGGGARPEQASAIIRGLPAEIDTGVAWNNGKAYF